VNTTPIIWVKAALHALVEKAIRVWPLVNQPNLSVMLGIASLFGLASARSRHGPSKRYPCAGKSIVDHVAGAGPIDVVGFMAKCNYAYLDCDQHSEGDWLVRAALRSIRRSR